MPLDATDPAPDGDGPEVVWRGVSGARAREMSLVLDALGIRCGVRRIGMESSVVVSADDAPAARAALSSYVDENRAWPPEEDGVDVVTSGWRSALAYVVVLVVFDHLQRRSIGGLPWHAAGQTRSTLITEAGEWWRVVTALFLHADVEHLVGNALFGALFGVFACQLYGAGLAWAATLATGALGNLANAFVRGPGHASLGASTAVFGALGIVVATEWARRDRRTRPLRRWGPPFLGACLLGYLGTSGERTDVMAHVLGFAWGLALGRLMAGARTRLSSSRAVQTWSVVALVAVVAAAWTVALV